MVFDNLCIAHSQSLDSIQDRSTTTETHECDYDKNPTGLYEAMENKAWLPCLQFFETGQWDNGVFWSNKDPLSPERQARTWVTRFEADGAVRWSQLPVHASLIFGAPYKVVSTLIKLYPQGVRCTDDQHMLPLHLAIKFGAEDNVVRLLLETFPESLFTKDIRSRLPTQVEGPRPDRTKILAETVAVLSKTLTKRHGVAMHDSIADLKDDLVLQNKLNAELEADKRTLEAKSAQAEVEIERLKKQVEELQITVGVSSRKKKTAKAPAKVQEKQPAKGATPTSNDASFVFGRAEESALEQAVKPKSPAELSSQNTVRRRGFFKGFGAKE